MELWLDCSDEYSEKISIYADRIWKGDLPDVAEIYLEDERSQDEAYSMIGLSPWILVRCKNWKMIPLENLISRSLGTGTKIAVSTDEKIEIEGAAYALEHGVDALLLPIDEEIWSQAIKIRKSKSTDNHKKKKGVSRLNVAKVTSIESGGFGERVCIDLIERLKEGEGIMVGSTSNALCLVHGETLESEFVPSRPFRVNVGAIHSYILMKDDVTKYLSELISGEKVKITNYDGNERYASIGRIKIERRPFLKISYSNEQIKGQIILQQAETVRLIDNLGRAVSVTNIKIGDKILVMQDSRMRHIGNAIEGEMSEI
jgi:3-dehydroquinate synthase II